MADYQADASPAHSDEGLDFLDAAEGTSPLVNVRNLTQNHTAHTAPTAEGEKIDLPQNEFQQAVSTSAKVTSPGPSPSSTSKGNNTGVAALRAKFQNGPSNPPAQNLGLASGSSSRSTSPSAPRKVGKLPKASTSAEANSVTETAASLSNTDGTSTLTTLEKAIDLATLSDEKKVAPSRGAQSLLDPEEIIKNPFCGSVSPSVGSFPDTPVLPDAPLPDESEPKRFSTSSAHPESDIVPETPTHSQGNRFSTISLSTAVDPRRVTVGANGFSTLSSDSTSDTSPPADFLARQTERLSKVEGARRSSIDGAVKIKEKVNEMRYGHSRQSSSSRRPGDASVPEAASESEHGTAKMDGEEGDETIGGEAIDWDFWGAVMSNYQEIAQTQPRQLSKAIQAGIPGALRGMMWQLMSSSKDEEMEIIYTYYLKQTSPHEKMIRKDLARTFPGQEYFADGKGIGQENLFNVVKAYSLYDEECGYCQGMQFVVGPLLLNMPDEEAFSTLVRLMKSYDLRGHFVPNMPALQLRLFQFDRLLEETLPLLHRHLVRSGVKSSMYASGWFMTLFSYRSPLEICFRILDSVFAEGIEALFRFALALMKKNEDTLLEMGFEEAVPLLAAKIFDIYKSDVGQEGHQSYISRDEQSGGAAVTGGYRVNEFVRDAFDFKITPFQLDSYASDFAEQVKVATAHRREMDEIKLQNKHLQVKVKNLEDQLGGLQQEHVDLVKSVVMAKLAKEEMAEELVRYKLMYAEATLLADQSGVNQNPRSVGSSGASSTHTSFARQSS